MCISAGKGGVWNRVGTLEYGHCIVGCALHALKVKTVIFRFQCRRWIFCPYRHALMRPLYLIGNRMERETFTTTEPIFCALEGNSDHLITWVRGKLLWCMMTILRNFKSSCEYKFAVVCIGKSEVVVESTGEITRETRVTFGLSPTRTMHPSPPRAWRAYHSQRHW